MNIGVWEIMTLRLHQLLMPIKNHDARSVQLDRISSSSGCATGCKAIMAASSTEGAENFEFLDIVSSYRTEYFELCEIGSSYKTVRASPSSAGGTGCKAI